ncbi:hypothetical protein [Streptomyces sp. NRRL F-525]|nr:hypothetical protein [Streptomyces sp. NRRL F-525]
MKSIGKDPQDGDNEPVWTKLLRQATVVVRLAGAIFQVVYYGLKIW